MSKIVQVSIDCRKKKYGDKISAMFALSQAKYCGNFTSRRNEKRIYFCEKCKAWHLTSQDKKC